MMCSDCSARFLWTLVHAVAIGGILVVHSHACEGIR